MFFPPMNIGDITKGTTHHKACAFFYIHCLIRKNWHFGAKKWTNRMSAT
jgi:hypothetical protein